MTDTWNDPRLRPIVDRQPYPLLFATISGAHLYGFPSPDSDFDLRGVHILPPREILGLDTGPETIEVSGDDGGLDMDLVTHDVKKFFGLLLKKNGYVLEQLYSPLVVHTTPEHQELKTIARTCITRHHAHHYFGFAETQWKLFEKESPRRVKPLLYVYRVLLTGIHLMRTGEVEANLVTLNEHFRLPYISPLVARKLSGPEQSALDNADFEFHRREYDGLRAELESAFQTSTLPEASSAQPALHDLLLRLRLDEHSLSTITLWRPVGEAELKLIRESAMSKFPPRLSTQPIFYPVLTEAYAIKIARDWNTKDATSGHVGYVTRFRVRQSFLERYDIHEAGGHEFREYWIPAESIDDFNANIIGPIEVTHEFRRSAEH